MKALVGLQTDLECSPKLPLNPRGLGHSPKCLEACWAEGELPTQRLSSGHLGQGLHVAETWGEMKLQQEQEEALVTVRGPDKKEQTAVSATGLRVKHLQGDIQGPDPVQMVP